jgi:hypothetical protein
MSLPRRYLQLVAVVVAAAILSIPAPALGASPSPERVSSGGLSPDLAPSARPAEPAQRQAAPVTRSPSPVTQTAPAGARVAAPAPRSQPAARSSKRDRARHHRRRHAALQVTLVKTGPPLYTSAQRALFRAVPAADHGVDRRQAAILAAAALFAVVAASGSLLRMTSRVRLR